MSISNQFFSEKLIEGYVKCPPTLKELANTRLAIQLCQHSQLKKRIFDSKGIYNEWERLLEVHSSKLCKTLGLPRVLKLQLINRLWLIANRIFSWNMEHKLILSLNSRHVADQFLMHSYWTDEGRINKGKVAEDLVQDGRIPVSERYQVACVNSLEPFIRHLWNQISFKHQREFADVQYFDIHKSSLVTLWSKVGLQTEKFFWENGLFSAVKEGQKTAVVYFWNKLSDSIKQECIVEIACRAFSEYYCVRSRFRHRHLGLPCYIHRYCSEKYCGMPTDYSDILYFLVSQMSGEKMVHFFETLYKYRRVCDPVGFYVWLIESPHQRYFITIITKLWDILPRKHYIKLLRELSVMHGKISNKDYNYGNLLIDLLERTPEEYYRYIFAKFDTLFGFFQVICNLTKSIDVENIVKHVPAAEMRTIMYSVLGKEFCNYLIKGGSRETLDLILTDCLPEMEIADFKKQFLLSYRGREIVFEILASENGECVNSLLNWGHLSEEEISDFKPKLILEVLMEKGKPMNSLKRDYIEKNSLRMLEGNLPQWNPIDAITNLLKRFDIESVDRVLEWCLPFEGARKLYKDQFVSILRNEKFTFCESILSPEFNLKRFSPKIPQFLCWAFSSEVDTRLFKMKLFAAGYPMRILRKLILHEQWPDVDAFIEFFELSPEEVKQLKKYLMWATDTLYNIFDLLYKSDSETVSHYLDWGLSDLESAIAFKQQVDEFIIDDSDRVKRDWDQLINCRLIHLAIVRPEEKRAAEKFVDG